MLPRLRCHTASGCLVIPVVQKQEGQTSFTSALCSQVTGCLPVLIKVDLFAELPASSGGSANHPPQPVLLQDGKSCTLRVSSKLKIQTPQVVRAPKSQFLCVVPQGGDVFYCAAMLSALWQQKWVESAWWPHRKGNCSLTVEYFVELSLASGTTNLASFVPVMASVTGLG